MRRLVLALCALLALTSAGDGTSSLLTGVGAPIISGGGGLTIAFVGVLDTTTGTATTAFGSLTFPGAGLAVVMGFARGTASPHQITALTVGGTGLTIDKQTASSNSAQATIGHLVIASGGSKAIGQTTTGTVSGNQAVCVYEITGTMVSATPTSSDAQDTSGTTTGLALTVTTPSPGVGLFGSLYGTTALTVTWSGATQDGAKNSTAAGTTSCASNTSSSGTVTPTVSTATTNADVGAGWH